MRKILSLALALLGCQAAEKQQAPPSAENIRDAQVKKISDSLNRVHGSAFDRMFGGYEGAEVWFDGSWNKHGPYTLPWGLVWKDGGWEKAPFDSTHPEWEKYKPYYEVLKRYEETKANAQ